MDGVQCARSGRIDEGRCDVSQVIFSRMLANDGKSLCCAERVNMKRLKKFDSHVTLTAEREGQVLSILLAQARFVLWGVLNQGSGMCVFRT